MKSDQREQIKEVFDSALSLPESERAQFVAKACKGDETLQAEIISLLESYSRAGEFLLTPPFSVPDSPIDGGNPPTGPTLQEKELISGRFEIVRMLAQGGMSEVYEARDLELRERVALKIVRSAFCSDARALERFKREIQLSRRVTHPGVCRIFDIGRHELPACPQRAPQEIVFLTMTFLEGETLAAAIRRKDGFSPAEALPLIEDMVSALAAAHEAGVIHRDFKPSNVMLTFRQTAAGMASSECSRATAVAMDFGIARAAEIDQKAWKEELTSGGAIPGTLAYMAPEQLEGHSATPATDIYALGLVMYEMLTGSRPFAEAGPLAVFRRVKTVPPAPCFVIPDLDPIWDSVILKCLQIDPADRFQSVREVSEALLHPSSQVLVASDEPIATPKRRVSAARKPWKAAIPLGGMVMALALIVLASWYYSKRLNAMQTGPGSQVVLAEIRNESGDRDLDSVTELLRSQLEQSAYLNLVPEGRIDEILRLMKRGGQSNTRQEPAKEALEPRQLRQVALRVGSPLVIFGTISRIADQLKLEIRLERVVDNPNQAATVWHFGDSASSKKDFFQVVQRASDWIRRQSGEAVKDIQNTDTPPQEVTTDNWDALRLYSSAQKLAAEQRMTDSVALLDEAIVQDPNFAIAYMRRADLLDMMGRYDDAEAAWQKAMLIANLSNTGAAAEPRDVTPREQLRITGIFANDTGSYKKADDIFHAYSVHFPNDFLGAFYRADINMTMGHPDQAIALLTQARAIAPESLYMPERLARFYVALGQQAEAEKWIARLRQMGAQGYADRAEGELRATLGDYARAVALFAGLRQSGDELLISDSYHLQAGALAEMGQYQEAANILEQGIRADEASGNIAWQADKLAGLSYVSFRMGDRTRGRDAAIKSLALQPDDRKRVDAGTLLARNGFDSDARNVLRPADMNSQLPVLEISRLRLQGEILVATGQQKKGLELLRRAWAMNEGRGVLRDYMAHGLEENGLLEESLEIYKDMNKWPGIVWCNAELYLPGQRADFRNGEREVTEKLSRTVVAHGE